MSEEVPVRSFEWNDGILSILDQRLLPREERQVTARTAEEVAEAIRSMAVRGAPLLGIVAGYGVALGAWRSGAEDVDELLRDLHRAGEVLKASRPTAANIAWAVDRVIAVAHQARQPAASRSLGGAVTGETVRKTVADEAGWIAAEDAASCQAIGRLGAELMPERANVLTHCNTGALATGGLGTAQAMIVTAHRSGKAVHVWVDETRPVLQGARLTAWELRRFGVPMTLVPDTAAGTLMAKGRVDAVVVGADRIARNGDVANKLGTYQLAALAGRHGVPFYVAAPFSTVDLSTPAGAAIVIEERDPGEVTAPAGVPFAPEGTPAFNPAFDVTPAELITALVTDRGILRPPFAPALIGLAGQGRGAPVPSDTPTEVPA